MIFSRQAGRWIVRIVLAAVFAALATQTIPWRWGAMILPALSPFSAVCSALALRSLSWFSLLAAPVTAICLFKKRWFCLYACPVGLLAESAGKLLPFRRDRLPRLPVLGRWIALFTIAASAIGYPLFLWLDPLSIFNGIFTPWRRPFERSEFMLAIGLVVILLLSLVWAGGWCFRFCPLGATQDILRDLGGMLQRIRRPRERHQRTASNADSAATGKHADAPSNVILFGRRSILAGFAGVAGGLAARFLDRTAPPLQIRPPGAANEDRFAGLCIRCGNCVRACPQRIIHPDTEPICLTGLFAPIVRIEPGYCAEWCNECNKVCPTGAISRLTLRHKQTTSIGQAVVIKPYCLAWDLGQYCTVCQEYCPYVAIKDKKYKGVPCPVVQADRCRGCGLCQKECPASPKAIIVQGVPQHPVPPLSSYA